MPIFKNKPIPEKETGRLAKLLRKAESFMGKEPDIMGISGPMGMAPIAGMARGRLLRKLQQLGFRESEFLDIVKKMPKRLLKEFPTVGDATRMLKGGTRYGRERTARLSNPKTFGFSLSDLPPGLNQITKEGELLPPAKAQIGLYGKIREGLGQGVASDKSTLVHEMGHFKSGHHISDKPIEKFSSRLTGSGNIKTPRPQNLAKVAKRRGGIELETLAEVEAEIPAMIFEGDTESLELLRAIHPKISKHIDTIIDELPLRTIREGMKGSK